MPKNLVKVEEDDGESHIVNHVKNDQLPPIIREHFTKILAIIMAWMAASSNPWKVNADELAEALEIAGRVYAGNDYVLENGRKSPEYIIVCVRSSLNYPN